MLASKHTTAASGTAGEGSRGPRRLGGLCGACQAGQVIRTNARMLQKR